MGSPSEWTTTLQIRDGVEASAEASVELSVELSVEVSVEVSVASVLVWIAKENHGAFCRADAQRFPGEARPSTQFDAGYAAENVELRAADCVA